MFAINDYARRRIKLSSKKVLKTRFLCNQVNIKVWLDAFKFALWSFLNN